MQSVHVLAEYLFGNPHVRELNSDLAHPRLHRGMFDPNRAFFRIHAFESDIRLEASRIFHVPCDVIYSNFDERMSLFLDNVPALNREVLASLQYDEPETGTIGSLLVSLIGSDDFLYK